MTEAPRGSLQEVQAALIDAIHRQRVASVAQEILDRPEGQRMPDATRAAEDALQACRIISAQVLDLRAEALAALAASGVHARAEPGPEDQTAAQFHATTLRVQPDALAQSIAALGQLGFRPPIPITAGRLRIVRRTMAVLRLVRFDGVSARLDLRFADRPATRMPRVLRPRLADLMLADLPAPVALAYWGLRPLRLVKDKLTGQAQEISEGGLLGTPDALIAPILDQFDLQPGDRFFDLGCGDGRLVAAAARRGAEAIGYEIDAALVAEARALCAREAPGARATILQGRAETADLSQASAIFLFVPSYLLAGLLPVIRRAAPAEARLVIHEQTRIAWDRPPDISLPVFGQGAMTVMHVWNARTAVSHGQDK